MVNDLLALGQPRPRFGPEVADGLRRDLEEALAPVAGGLDGDPLWVTKQALAQVHACEGHYRSEQEAFDWNPRTATGTVVHKALHLLISARGEVAPLDVVDHAIAAFDDDTRRSSPGTWLRQASELELAELRALANEAVVKYLECWPPLPARWVPRTETGLGADLCGGRVVLRGKVDLALGIARGDEARVLIVDLKTGRSQPHRHLDDLRFYALVQTLRVGVPPFRVASYYLDTATFHAEDVTTELLETTARRTVDAVAKMARLLDHAAVPAITPGPTCRWCRVAAECPGPATLDRDIDESGAL